MRRSILLALIALALLVPATASAATRTVTSGDVTAKLSYSDDPTVQTGDMRLTIVRAGATLVDSQLVTDPSCSAECAPVAGGFGRRSPLFARDLDGDGEPEVIVDGYTGGAHCCDIAFVYRFTGSGYALSMRNFADPGFRLATLGGPVFVSADARFAYEFTSFAFSGMPIQILRFDSGRFVDVTRRHRPEVRADQRRWLRLYERGRRHHRSDVRGVLAAYVADGYLLGQKRRALHLLAVANRRHDLRGPGGADGWPRDGRYIRALKRFLRRYGYA